MKFDTKGWVDTMPSEVVEPPLGNLSKYQTRILFNSLKPVFGEVFELNLQMNTKIFEYLKNNFTKTIEIFNIQNAVEETLMIQSDKAEMKNIET